jgi:hypothetical protein
MLVVVVDAVIDAVRRLGVDAAIMQVELVLGVVERVVELVVEALWLVEREVVCVLREGVAATRGRVRTEPRFVFGGAGA